MKNDKLKKKYDKYIEGIDAFNNQYSISIGPERWLAPEMFFNPEIIYEKYKQSVD